jgi:hypothetical protein
MLCEDGFGSRACWLEASICLIIMHVCVIEPAYV